MLLGGPERDDGLGSFVRELGAEAVVYYLERSEGHNLADEGVWSGIRGDIESDVYQAKFSAPPCGSFCANRGIGPGPRVFRGAEVSDLFGLPNSEPSEKDTVRIGTLLALRTAEASKLPELISLEGVHFKGFV